MADDFIDTHEAAASLGVARATLWKLLKERRIATYQIPGRRRSYVKRADLDGLRRPIPRPRARELHVQHDERAE